MKIICTTSNSYKHLIPVFIHLFNKYWGAPVELVGYEHPGCELPSNFSFVSLGKQDEDKKNFTRDLRKYFAKQPKYFIWLMEDTFVKEVNIPAYHFIQNFIEMHDKHIAKQIGKIYLCDEVKKQQSNLYETHIVNGITYQLFSHQKNTVYRLSTQISIWNKYFLLQYMADDLTPWEFEAQGDHADDDFVVLGMKDHAPVKHNEGVRKHDLHTLDLNGIDEMVINEMKQIEII